MGRRPPDERNIRVVNISLTSTVPDSYKQDPLDAAVEQAWLHGVVVVVAAGTTEQTHTQSTMPQPTTLTSLR